MLTAAKLLSPFYYFRCFWRVIGALTGVTDKMVNGSRFYRALESVSNQHGISFIYRFYDLPMPNPSPLMLTVLNSNFLQLKRRVVAGHSGKFTPGGYLSTVKHTALARIEPTTSDC